MLNELLDKSDGRKGNRYAIWHVRVKDYIIKKKRKTKTTVALSPAPFITQPNVLFALSPFVFN